MAYRLQASIIEAKSIEADTESSLNFYVRVRVGSQQAKTVVSRAQANFRPLFLQDVRLDFDQDVETLKVELLQAGPRGDLVIGTLELSVAALARQGPEVAWYQLRDAMGDVTAELCMVVRVHSGTGKSQKSRAFMRMSQKEKKRALLESRVSMPNAKAPMSVALPRHTILAALAALVATALLGARGGDPGERHFKRDLGRLRLLGKEALSRMDLLYPGDRVRVR